MFCNKKGSTAVFLTIALASTLLLASVLIKAAGMSAGRSYGDAAFQLAGRSLISEFDRRLFEDYGLFAMRTDEESAAKKLKYYSDASLDRNKLNTWGAVWLLKCDVGDVSVDLKEYSLLDVNVFEKQMLDDAKYVIAQNLKEALVSKPGTPGTYDSGSGSGSGSGDDELGKRKIQNQAVINGLPSKGLGDGGFDIGAIISKGVPQPDELLSGVGDTFLTTEYILARFAAANTEIPSLAAGHDRFFRNEAEYIAIGNYDDKKNYNDAMFRIGLLRFALNEITIHTDKVISKEATAVAASIQAMVPPGPWTPFIPELVKAAWCAIEAENDLKLLKEGEKVPLYKKSENWALEGKNVINAIIEYIESGVEATPETSGAQSQAKSKTAGAPALKPKKVEGFIYVDYLRALLYFTPRETKLLRAMDLIQLNMKTGYYADFLMHEHYAGLKYQVVMNNDTFVYEQKYEKG